MKINEIVMSVDELWDLADKGDYSIINDPRIGTIWRRGETPLHALADAGVLEILDHRLVSHVKTYTGDTPLHVLARGGHAEVTRHKDVDVVRNNLGNTPLHELAIAGVREVASHPSFWKVKNDSGETPYNLWDESEHGKITCADLV